MGLLLDCLTVTVQDEGFIAGWMSAKMLERYSQTRQQAKRDAVNKLPR